MSGKGGLDVAMDMDQVMKKYMICIQNYQVMKTTTFEQ